MNAIVPVHMAFGEMVQLANAIAKSNLFGMKTPEQALVMLTIAQAEGRHPALAARDYDIIQNRPAKKSEAMLRDFIEGGGKVEWHALTDALADATFSHPQGGTVRISWDMARAMQAGLGGKPTWKQFPRQMLRSRTVSEGVRTVWPLATSGMYVPEEAADMPKAPSFDGPTIEAEPDARDALNASVPVRAAAAATPRAARVAERAPAYEAGPAEAPEEAPKRRTARDFLDATKIALRDAKDEHEADRVLCSEDVLRAKAAFTGDSKTELEKMISAALARWWPQAPDAEPAPDDDPFAPGLEIVGQEKLGA